MQQRGHNQSGKQFKLPYLTCHKGIARTHQRIREVSAMRDLMLLNENERFENNKERQTCSEALYTTSSEMPSLFFWISFKYLRSIATKSSFALTNRVLAFFDSVSLCSRVTLKVPGVLCKRPTSSNAQGLDSLASWIKVPVLR